MIEVDPGCNVILASQGRFDSLTGIAWQIHS